MTVALKGALITLANSVLGALQAFGVPLSNVQQAAVIGLANSVLLVWMLAEHRKAP